MTLQSRAHILVVDDNPSLARATALILEHKGYTVTTAQNGLEAVEKVRQQTFESVLMDVKMPHIDGVEAFRRIKRIKPETNVVIVTAYVVDDLIQQALNEGACGLLHKPIDIERLLGMLDQIVTHSDNTGEE